MTTSYHTTVSIFLFILSSRTTAARMSCIIFLAAPSHARATRRYTYKQARSAFEVDRDACSFFILAVCSNGKPNGKAAEAMPKLKAKLRRRVEPEYQAHPFLLLNFHSEIEVEGLLKGFGISRPTERAESICQAAALWVADMLDLTNTSCEQLVKIRGVSNQVAVFYLLNAQSVLKG